MRDNRIKNILAIIERETESSILSKCIKCEIVDSRHIYVYCLHKLGYYTSQIAFYTKLSARQVNHILLNFDNRLKNSNIMSYNFAIIKKLIRSELDISI